MVAALSFFTLKVDYSQAIVSIISLPIYVSRRVKMQIRNRPWYPGCTYHVTARGSHKCDIFLQKEDFRMYIYILKETIKHYDDANYELLCHCLMTNHVHLIIKANNKALGCFMQRIHSIYATYYNKKYDFSGHLFQGKYHSVIINNVIQMIETSKYIHLNPVRAAITNKPENYQYSSYKTYIGDKNERCVNRDIVLEYFGFDQRCYAYKKYVESRI